MSRRDLTFRELRDANVRRIPTFKNAKGELAHNADGSDWSMGDWSNATLGELGEAANLIKKIRRGDFTIDEKREELAKELADVVTYLDILAFRAGIDLGQATVDKFNEISRRVGSPVRLHETDDNGHAPACMRAVLGCTDECAIHECVAGCKP